MVQVQIAERRSKTPLAIRNLVDDLERRKTFAEWKASTDEEMLAERGSST